MSELRSAREVKNELLSKFGTEPWFAGIGTSREDGIGFVVRVSVRAGIPRPDDALPPQIRGVHVQVIETGER